MTRARAWHGYAQVVHGQRRVDLVVLRLGASGSAAQRERTDHRLERAGGAERVTGGALGRDAGDRIAGTPVRRGPRRHVARRAGTVES